MCATAKKDRSLAPRRCPGFTTYDPAWFDRYRPVRSCRTSANDATLWGGDATLDEGMTSVLQSLTTLPSYLLFALVMLGFLLLFILAYTAVTPYRDLALVRQGNTTAALTLGGAMIGFALPLTSVASHTSSIVDLAVWGMIALVSQLLAYVIGSRVLLPEFRAGVEADRTAYGILLASLSIAVGLLNYGSLTY